MSGQHPVSAYDPDELRAMVETFNAPHGVPAHSTQIDAEQRHEELEPGRPLDPELTWFSLGLAYSLIKIDRSLFEVYQAAGNFTIPVRSYQAAEPIISAPGSEYHTNPWIAIVQGIPASHRRPFIDFVASYLFSRGATKYRCGFQEIRVRDPFAESGVPVWFALPDNTTARRRVVVAQSSGLWLTPPVMKVETYV
jgi:hypothetical protein